MEKLLACKQQKYSICRLYITELIINNRDVKLEFVSKLKLESKK